MHSTDFPSGHFYTGDCYVFLCRYEYPPEEKGERDGDGAVVSVFFIPKTTLTPRVAMEIITGRYLVGK